MQLPQILLLSVLAITMGMFLWGRWRHDMVALGALLASVGLGLVPADKAFSGFGHPAVVTVAAVLVLGHGLHVTGVADALAQRLIPRAAGPTLTLIALMSLAAVLSAFMNNVGALALMMPIALQLAAKHDMPPGRFLMPLAIASILGGMMTLIGTPPNLIVSGYRASAAAEPFGMFAFAPAGLAITVCGVAFIGAIGWRLVPVRRQAQNGAFESDAYLSEVRLTAESKAVGKRIREVERMMDEADAQIITLVRNEVQIRAPHPNRALREGDILVIEVEPESLAAALARLGMKLEEDKPADAEKDNGKESPKASRRKDASRKTGGEDAPAEDKAGGRETIAVQEFVVMPGSGLVRQSATDLQLRTLHGINLLAISRRGQRSIRRLRSTKIKEGDVLLLQGDPEQLADFAAAQRCLPLAERNIRIPRKGKAWFAGAIMLLAVGAAAAGWWPASVTFAAGALLYVALDIVPPRHVYEAIDWPVILLLAAMLPVADAMATTGTAERIAELVLHHVARGSVPAAVAALMVLTLLLSSVINNAATAALMCPIALGVAYSLNARPDGFLMAVAIGASCAFLTPIGHQNNTLILGPGGFRFGDYWRLGLPMVVLTIGVGVPILLRVFPP